MTSKAKNRLIILVLLICSVVISFLLINLQSDKTHVRAELTSILAQEKYFSNSAKKYYTIYKDNKILAFLTDYQLFKDLANQIYEEKYAKDFPNSSLGLKESYYIQEEYLNYQIENKDAEILKYLKDNNLFAIEVYAITFSGTDTIFVKQLQDFYDAQQSYLLNYVDADTLNRINNKQELLAKDSYGDYITGFKIDTKIEIAKDYVSEDKILKTKEDIIRYLSFGKLKNFNYYTTEKYDTVEGVASKTGIETNNLIAINSDILKSANQLLAENIKLNVTKINSPLNVVVTKRKLQKEVIYPSDTEYIYDESMIEGTRVLVQEAKNGYKNVQYEDEYINGILSKGKEISSLIIENPVHEIVKVGTFVIPNIGSGQFRWPVENPRVTCGWGCYWGHTGTDIQPIYNVNGPIYASDRGTVVENSYTSINGYYVVIDHNNGYQTYYGHMIAPGSVSVGQTVYAGQVIGYVGQTGYATGPHVHFEIRKNGNPLNACWFLGC